MRSILSAGVTALLLTVLPAAAVTVKKSEYAKLPDGSPVSLFTVTNAKGMEARIMTWGGVLVSLKTPDRTGHLADVVLGHDSLRDYRADTGTYFGALIGRYANRIGGAQFKLDGKTQRKPFFPASSKGPHELEILTR